MGKYRYPDMISVNFPDIFSRTDFCVTMQNKIKVPSVIFR